MPVHAKTTLDTRSRHCLLPVRQVLLVLVVGNVESGVDLDDALLIAQCACAVGVVTGLPRPVHVAQAHTSVHEFKDTCSLNNVQFCTSTLYVSKPLHVHAPTIGWTSSHVRYVDNNSSQGRTFYRMAKLDNLVKAINMCRQKQNCKN